MRGKLFKRKSGKFKIGDIVKIANKSWYGFGKTWFVSHIYKDGGMVLRHVHTENNTIEIYNPKDLVKQ